MLGGNHFEREESVNSNLPRRFDSINCNASENNEENLYSNPREVRQTNNADCGQNSTSNNSSAEINTLSSELNSRISREIDEMMNNVSVQIQRAINDANSDQVLPQIQNAIIAVSGRDTKGMSRSGRETGIYCQTFPQ